MHLAPYGYADNLYNCEPSLLPMLFILGVAIQSARLLCIFEHVCSAEGEGRTWHGEHENNKLRFVSFTLLVVTGGDGRARPSNIGDGEPDGAHLPRLGGGVRSRYPRDGHILGKCVGVLDAG